MICHQTRYSNFSQHVSEIDLDIFLLMTSIKYYVLIELVIKK